MNTVLPKQDGVVEAVSPRKRILRDHAEASAGEQFLGGKYNASYREDDLKFTRFLIPPGKRVLELGCGRGDMLATLQPSYGVGVDFSARTIERARALHPDLHLYWATRRIRRRWRPSRVRSTIL